MLIRIILFGSKPASAMPNIVCLSEPIDRRFLQESEAAQEAKAYRFGYHK